MLCELSSCAPFIPAVAKAPSLTFLRLHLPDAPLLASGRIPPDAGIPRRLLRQHLSLEVTVFRDPFVQKAWELCQQTTHCSLEVILEATMWLEEKYAQTPYELLARNIALQYLILAMRRELRATPVRAKEYFARALHWREEASRWVSTPGPLVAAQSRN